MPRARASASGVRMDNGVNWENPDECMFRKHDDAMHMITCGCNAHDSMMKCNKPNKSHSVNKNR